MLEHPVSLSLTNDRDSHNIKRNAPTVLAPTNQFVTKTKDIFKYVTTIIRKLHTKLQIILPKGLADEKLCGTCKISENPLVIKRKRGTKIYHFKKIKHILTQC